jgi:hypothetical protein
LKLKGEARPTISACQTCSNLNSLLHKRTEFEVKKKLMAPMAVFHELRRRALSIANDWPIKTSQMGG